MMESSFSIERDALDHIPVTVSVTASVEEWRMIKKHISNSISGGDLSANRVRSLLVEIGYALEHFEMMEHQSFKHSPNNE